MRCPKCGSEKTGFEWFDDNKGNEGDAARCHDCDYVWDEEARETCEVCDVSYFDGGYELGVCSHLCAKKHKVLLTASRWAAPIAFKGVLDFSLRDAIHAMGKKSKNIRLLSKGDVVRWCERDFPNDIARVIVNGPDDFQIIIGSDAESVANPRWGGGPGW